MEATLREVTTTYLEMRSPAELKPCFSPALRVREVIEADGELNRWLYFTVGEQWHWLDKRGWSDEQWCEYAKNPALRTFLAEVDDEIAGYFELHRQAGDVEIAYFGLLVEFVGRGLGGALLTSAIEHAWQWNASRVWVHTCTLDHPAALQNYLARGLRIYGTAKHTIQNKLPNET